MNAAAARAPDAADPKHSAWVSAHAGTGKTYTLANRVTRLLLEGAAPERILCLTYTKAAAAEMAGRLFDQLGRWAMLPDAELARHVEEIGADQRNAEGLRGARRLFALALETPGGLKIQTIHSFCQYLLARFPLEAGVPPSFDVLDEQTAHDLAAAARLAVLERAGEGDEMLAHAAAYLATHAEDGRIRQILDSVLGGDRRKFERFLARVGSDAAAIAAAVARAHGAQPGDRYEDIAAGFCVEMQTAKAQLGEIARWLGGGQSTDRKLADALAAALESGSFEDFRSVFFTANGTPRKRLATNKLVDGNHELYMQFEELAIRFAEAEQRCRAAHAAALAQAALTLAQAAHAAYAREKRARGVLDYDDLIARALHLLDRRAAAAWVLYKLDGGIEHILIDEGQDTSPEQWRIVRRLTEEFFSGKGARDADAAARTLFVVGDEKQSIFSFQGADPKQFEINRRHFEQRAGGTGLVSVQLTKSRRSAREILSFVDAVFASEAVRDGVSSTEVQHDTARETALGRVEFWPTIKPGETPKPDPWQQPVDFVPEASPVDQLAEQIAARIHAWTDGRTCLPGHQAPIRPGDIMVLMPRREPFASELIRHLKQRGVPVAGADRIRLLEQIAVQDLVALGRFALLPEDELNLAALLRSPLIGLSEDELFALAQPRAGGLWREIAARREERPPLAFAYEFLEECRARADFTAPYEFYAHALGPRGMRERLLARLGVDANDAIDEFLSLCFAHERLNTPALEGFLHWLERGEAEVKRDMERSRDEVRVMTVHGAKGLEADIVILPDTTTIPEGAGKHGALLYTDDGIVFPMADREAPESVRAAKQEADADTLREHRRLLYVALTRARDHLHICGFEGKRGVREGSWYDLMKPVAERLGIPVIRGTETVHVIGGAETQSAAHIPPAPAHATLPGWAKTLPPAERASPRIIRPSQAAGFDEPARGSPLAASGTTGSERGLLVHALLARLPDLPPEKRGEAARVFLKRRGIDAEMAEALIGETLAVLDHPDFAAAFTPAARAEVPIVATLPELGEGALVSGRIDRLAIAGDDVLAIDFKTNRPAPRRLADVPQIYVSQLALYRAALALIFPEKRIACALVWTDGPSLMPVPAELLEAEIGRIAARLDPSSNRS